MSSHIGILFWYTYVVLTCTYSISFTVYPLKGLHRFIDVCNASVCLNSRGPRIHWCPTKYNVFSGFLLDVPACETTTLNNPDPPNDRTTVPRDEVLELFFHTFRSHHSWGSMGRTAYLPTVGLDLYGKCREYFPWSYGSWGNSWKFHCMSFLRVKVGRVLQFYPVAGACHCWLEVKNKGFGPQTRLANTLQGTAIFSSLKKKQASDRSIHWTFIDQHWSFQSGDF